MTIRISHLYEFSVELAAVREEGSVRKGKIDFPLRQSHEEGLRLMNEWIWNIFILMLMMLIIIIRE